MNFNDEKCRKSTVSAECIDYKNGKRILDLVSKLKIFIKTD